GGGRAGTASVSEDRERLRRPALARGLGPLAGDCAGADPRVSPYSGWELLERAWPEVAHIVNIARCGRAVRGSGRAHPGCVLPAHRTGFPPPRRRPRPMRGPGVGPESPTARTTGLPRGRWAGDRSDRR